MILTRAGQVRQEVELVPPDQAVDGQALPIVAESPPAAIELPQPVCPDGSPRSPVGMEEPLPPGVAVVDELTASDSHDIVTAEIVETYDEEAHHDQ